MGTGVPILHAKEEEPMLKPDLSVSEPRLRQLLHAGQNFDSIARPVVLHGRRAAFFLIDGFVKDELFEKILEYLYGLSDDSLFASPDAFVDGAIPYCETALEGDEDKVVTAVLSGQTALLIDGFDRAVLIDIRTYPQRDTSEPDKDKTFRGSRDGFVETMVLNCALIRRRIRSPRLRMEAFQVGSESKTDVTLCYMDGRVDTALLQKVQDKLKTTPVPALTMNQESLAEVLLPHKWYNPFPKFKYTERPDTAAAQVLEGDIIILVDNSPSAMMIPTSIFDIMEEANDYYFPPITGTYLRLTRFFVLVLMLLLTPVWLLLIQNPAWVPPWLGFIFLQENPFVPVFWQLLILEVGIDGLKLATLNTPNMLTTSLSVIAGIVVGDFAVKSGWFSAEPMLYMAIVALGSYNQPSWELGYSFKFLRIMLLVLTYLFNLWGLLAGLAAVFVMLLMNKTFAGTSYLYPLIPLDLNVLRKKLFRPSIHRQ